MKKRCRASVKAKFGYANKIIKIPFDIFEEFV